MCPFASLPFSTDGHLLTSQDALILDAAALNTDMLYVIELVNEVRDFAATDPPQDATTGRRLLSGLFPLGEASAGTVRQENSGRGYAQSSGGAFVVEGPETNVDPADTTPAEKAWSIVTGLLYCFFLLSSVWPCKVFYKPMGSQSHWQAGKVKANGKPEYDRCTTLFCFLVMLILFVLSMFHLEHDVLIIPTGLSVSTWLFCFMMGDKWFTKDKSSNDWVSFEGRERTEKCPKQLPMCLASMIFLFSLFYYIITIWGWKAADPSNTAIMVLNFVLFAPLFFVLAHRFTHIRPRDAKDSNEKVKLIPTSDSAFGGKFGEEGIRNFAVSGSSTTKFKV
jgi:hypothetical protein